MPVVPAHVPKYEIQPPTTTGDNGEPSASIKADAHRVFALIQDERHLVAHKLYLNVRERLNEWWKTISTSNGNTSGGGNSSHSNPLDSGATTTTTTPASTSNGSSNSSSTNKRSAFSRLGKKQQPQPKKSKEELLLDQEMEEALEFLASRKEKIDKLEGRCRLFRQAQSNLRLSQDWIFASHHFGIKTCYRRETDGSLSIKLEGEMNDVPLLEQICVLKETDLHHKWAPFCPCSMTIADLDKIDVVGWFLIGIPLFGLARDGCYRAVGCDNVEDDGCVYLVAQGIQDRKPGSPPPEDTTLSGDPVIDVLNVPPIPNRRGSGRLTIKIFEAMIHVNSPTSVNTCIVANLDPNVSLLPQSLLDFIMKQMAGVLLAKLQGAAKKILKHPATNDHAKRMRQEKAFYKDWLMVKFEQICALRGWEMPHVPAFDHFDEEPLIARQAVQRSQTYNGASNTSKSSNDDDDLDNSNDENNNETPVLPTRQALDNNNRAQTYNGTGATNNTSTSEYDSESEGRGAGGGAGGQHGTLASPDSSNNQNSNSQGGNISLRSNQILLYIREMEERTKKRKEAQIADSRRIAADRLKPKDWSTEKLERLNQLKQAKEKRQRNLSFTTTKAGAGGDGDVRRSSVRKRKSIGSSLSKKITDTLFSHGAVTRCIILLWLVLLLFVLLQASELSIVGAALARYVPNYGNNNNNDTVPQQQQLRVFLEDLAMMVYIMVCGLLHFILCDVALVYAFSSMRLGSKAGRQIKRYYSEKVRVPVAGVSAGIVVVSLVRSLGRLALIGMIWSFLKGSRQAQEILLLGCTHAIQFTQLGWSKIVEKIGSGSDDGSFELLNDLSRHTQSAATLVSAVLVKTSGAAPIVGNVLKLVGRFLYLSVVDSNLLGRTMSFIVLSIFAFFASGAGRIMNVLSELYSDAVNLELDPSPLSFGKDAFSTAKTIYSYSAVFLLTLIALFKLSTRNKTVPIRLSSNDDQLSSIGTSTEDDLSIYSPNQFSGLSTLGDDQSYQSNFSFRSPTVNNPITTPLCETIPEEEHSMNEASGMATGMASPHVKKRLNYGKAVSAAVAKPEREGFAKLFHKSKTY